MNNFSKRLLVSWLVRVLALGVAASAVSFIGLTLVANELDAPIPALPAPERFVDLAFSDLMVVAPRDLLVTLPITGTLRPGRETTLRAKVAGDLMQVAAREGEAVKAGQALARIDTVVLEARLRQHIAKLASSRAQLAQAQRTHDINLGLIDKGYVARNAFENSQSQFQKIEASVRARDEQVELARLALASALVSAPMDGFVAQRFVQAGDKAAVDSPLFTIVDLAEMALEVSVPASDIPRVRVGQEVSFHVEGFDGREFTGAVERINPTAPQGSRAIVIYIAVPNADAVLKGGMFVKGHLTVAKHAAVNVVPINAVRYEKGEALVYRLEGGKLFRQPVTLGAASEELGIVEVLEGLNPGQRIIKTNLGNFTEGLSAHVGESG